MNNSPEGPFSGLKAAKVIATHPPTVGRATKPGNHKEPAQSPRPCPPPGREAISFARQIGAKLYELRTTTSLSRLLAKQGKRDEARTRLAEIYGWFTEGFDTADLKDAKALLDELSA